LRRPPLADDTTMRILIAGAVLLLAGLVGIVATHDPAGPAASSAGNAAAAAAASDLAPVAILTRGDDIDIAASVPQSGWTIVEFTADW